ncbi:MAG: hypothetical protein ACOC2U_03605 [bacterium]
MIESIIIFTITDWISILAAIAALITAVVTLLTVREIKKQREHSYQPDLDIANFNVYVYRYDNDEEDEDYNKNLIFLFYSKQKLNDDTKIDGYNELVLDVNNIGFGAAKTINWKWDFDFVAVKKLLNLSENEFKLEKEKDELNIEIPDLRIGWAYYLVEENETDYINFILPYSIENRENTFRLPNYFIDLFWLYKSKGVVSKTYDSDENFPPLKLTMTYLNIDGKKFEKRFNIYLKFHHISHPFNKEKNLGKFRFEIQKIK